jgi:hypothetical protein
MHQALQGGTFHIEHIVPSSRGGPSTPDNLALSCPGCNLHKSDRTEGVDPETDSSVPLFNPRTDVWEVHFQWDGYQIVGMTTAGRATVHALQLNHHRRIVIRRAEELMGLFPP